MIEPAVSPKRAMYLRDVRRQSRRVRLWQLAILAGFFAFWELSCRIGLSDGFLVSSPSRIAATFLSLCRSGDVLVHVGVSCWETAVGFLLGTAAGTVVAVAMWWWPTLSRVLDPYLVVLNALPKTALGPIFIVWMGAGTGAIIVMTLAISLIVTILNMYEGFRATDAQKTRLMAAMGASRWQLLRMLVFPANYATLLNTLKVNVGLSWVGVIMGEFLVSRAGLGYLIVYGSQVFNMDLVMAPHPHRRGGAQQGAGGEAQHRLAAGHGYMPPQLTGAAQRPQRPRHAAGAADQKAVGQPHAAAELPQDEQPRRQQRQHRQNEQHAGAADLLHMGPRIRGIGGLPLLGWHIRVEGPRAAQGTNLFAVRQLYAAFDTIHDALLSRVTAGCSPPLRGDPADAARGKNAIPAPVPGCCGYS